MTVKNGVHFIGIGGIGMSALAQIMLHRGHKVSGSDLSENNEVLELRANGALVSLGHDALNIPLSTSRVIVSSAIRKTNPELIAAKERGLPIYHRSDLLAELFLDSDNSVAVSGSHGKTTVSSIIATILKSAKKDPTCVIGGQVAALNGNASAGSSDIFVAEADESDATFLKYFSKYGVITNIDADHMDYYSSIDDIIKVFKIFASHVSQDGALFLCADDPVASSLTFDSHVKVITYGIKKPAHIFAKNIKLAPYSSSFDLYINGKNQGRLEVSVPGKHNILNTLPAIGFCLQLGLTLEEIAEGLKLFSGAGRRFEIKGICDGITVIDDYGHHPSEIKATLEAARGLGAKRVVVVFQPHRYSRTKFFSREFGRCFLDCDKLFITDIYAASEEPIPGVTSKIILDHMPMAHRRKVKMVKRVEDVKYHLLNYVEPGDVIFTMGAGSVTTVGPQILDSMRARSYGLDSLAAEAVV